jgi:hypothetical protein
MTMDKTSLVDITVDKMSVDDMTAVDMTCWKKSVPCFYSSKQADRQAGIQTDGRVDRRADGQGGGWTDEQMEGRKDRQRTFPE